MREDLPIGVVEVGGTFASELKVLMLVLTNRYMSGSTQPSSALIALHLPPGGKGKQGGIGIGDNEPVYEDISRLKDWI